MLYVQPSPSGGKLAYTIGQADVRGIILSSHLQN